MFKSYFKRHSTGAKKCTNWSAFLPDADIIVSGYASVKDVYDKMPRKD